MNMQTTISIQKATGKDFAAIGRLLTDNNLPVADLNPLLDNFFTALEDNQIIGVMGMDRYGKAGLLRSAVVNANHRSTGVAGKVYNQLLLFAQQEGITDLYLITNTAEHYFDKKGFTKIAREAVPSTVLQSREFNGLCPASSVIMHLAV
jgi:amino-acid N-acetyltransferase